MKIAIFYHTFQSEMGAFVYQSQIHRLYCSGLIDAADYIHIGVNGDQEMFNVPEKAKVVYNSKEYWTTEKQTLVDLMSKEFPVGADAVNAARAFMLSLGCIQARECNKNTCPVGIATQNKTLVKGLNPEEKKVRVYNYHHAIIGEIKELIAAMGYTSISSVSPYDFAKRDKSGVLKNMYNEQEKIAI